MENTTRTGDPPPTTAQREADALIRVQLRDAQHRVRNDLQTIFSMLRLAESRMEGSSVAVSDVVLWLNCVASVYDALPIWDQNRRVPIRVLLTVLRDRIQGPSLTVSDDDESSVPGTSGIALALGLAGLLGCVTDYGDGSANASIRTADGRTSVALAFDARAAVPEEWLSPGCRAAVDALGGACLGGRDGERATIALEIPCR